MEEPDRQSLQQGHQGPVRDHCVIPFLKDQLSQICLLTEQRIRVTEQILIHHKKSCRVRLDPPAAQKAAATQKLSVAQKPVAAQKPLVTHKSSASQERELVSGDTIRKIGADIEKHRTISEIAARRNLSRELAEEIVRLYVTHPGVTPEQIMSKMGL